MGVIGGQMQGSYGMILTIKSREEGEKLLDAAFDMGLGGKLYYSRIGNGAIAYVELPEATDRDCQAIRRQVMRAAR